MPSDTPQTTPRRLPAITVWQPWASLIAEELKPFEFRGWAAPRRFIGQRIAVHAGARPLRISEVADLINRLSDRNWRQTGLSDQGKSLDLLERVYRAYGTKPVTLLMPHSSVVCTATLGEPVRDAELAQRMEVEWLNDSDRDDHSNWGWPMLDVERTEPPLPARGAQGFWTVEIAA